jgi:hypothetical protein
MHQDPAFWTGLFTFLVAVTAAGRYLIGRVFSYWTALTKKRTEDAVQIENLKNQFASKMLEELTGTTTMMKNVMVALQKQIDENKTEQRGSNAKLASDIEKITALIVSTQDIVAEIREFYSESQSTMARVRAGGLSVLKRLEAVEEKVSEFGKVIRK